MAGKTLAEIIDYSAAPLVQWEPAIDAPISQGKVIENLLTHFAVSDVLRDLGAKRVTGVIADEAMLEIAVAALVVGVEQVTHLTLQGQFEKVAQRNLQNMIDEADVPHSDLVRVTSDVSSIAPGSQDAVVANMILGCLVTAQDHGNLHKMLTFMASLLKPEGKLVVVRPNPEGGAFQTYSCLTPRDMLRAGEDYEFTVKGLEDLGPMKNLYTPDSFLQQAFDCAGFMMGETQPVEDIFDRRSGTAPRYPFLLNVCSLKR